jgi:hypothetical protein
MVETVVAVIARRFARDAAHDDRQLGAVASSVHGQKSAAPPRFA